MFIGSSAWIARAVQRLEQYSDHRAPAAPRSATSGAASPQRGTVVDAICHGDGMSFLAGRWITSTLPSGSISATAGRCRPGGGVLSRDRPRLRAGQPLNPGADLASDSPSGADTASWQGVVRVNRMACRPQRWLPRYTAATATNPLTGPGSGEAAIAAAIACSEAGTAAARPALPRSRSLVPEPAIVNSPPAANRQRARSCQRTPRSLSDGFSARYPLIDPSCSPSEATISWR